ncbi:hypothetical protein BH10ACI1_BH10ACI1_28940 [soil metagenome]
MQKIKYNFSLIIGLVLIFGATTAVFSQNKQNKNSGILTVKTSPEAYPVKVDGQVIGMSGVSSEAVFYLTPGNHLVEVEGPNGQKFTKEINFVKGQKHCVCLKVVETTTKRPCPYDIYVQGPTKYVDGDTIYFKAFNKVTTGAIPVNYVWNVSPTPATITDGLNTDTIAVLVKGLNGQQIRVTLDVNDGVYDEKCKQKIDTKTDAETIVIPKAYRCDIFEFGPFDDAKARFDNCVIELQNNPDAQLYIIFYQGTDRTSTTRNTVEKLQKRTLEYLVRTRGVDPSRIVLTKWGTQPRTGVEIWIVPPGATQPVPQ